MQKSLSKLCKQVGFDVRLGTTNRDPKTDELIWGYLLCSKEGMRREKKPENNHQIGDALKFFPITTGSNSKEIKRKKEGKGKEKCDENDNTQKKFKHVRENCKAIVGLRKTKMGLGK